MTLPIEDLTPRQIVAELDRTIIGQLAAKRAVAVALRNRYRRQQLPPEERDEVLPKNILMIGPTGVGKTEIARRLAQLARAPFVKVEATKFTEVGYVGRDVESIVRDLVSAAVRLVEKERADTVRDEAEKAALDRLATLLEDDDPTFARRTGHDAFIRSAWQAMQSVGDHGWADRPDEPVTDPEEEARQYEERRAQLLEEIRSGQHDDRFVEVDSEEPNNPFLQVFTAQGMEEMGLDGNPAMGGPFGSKRVRRRVTVRDAKEMLVEQESQRMVDRPGLYREAIRRAEQTGIVFLDEIDKVAGKQGGTGPDVSREGVQRDLLPVIEGSTVPTKYGQVRTDHILFIAAGAFHMSKPSDLIPELQGRLPIRVELDPLSQMDFRRILREPKNALTTQYERLLAVDGVKVEFTDDAIDEIASYAAAINERIENIGARRLHTVMERVLEPELYDAPEAASRTLRLDAAEVKRRLGNIGSEEERRVL